MSSPRPMAASLMGPPPPPQSHVPPPRESPSPRPAIDPCQQQHQRPPSASPPQRPRDVNASANAQDDAEKDISSVHEERASELPDEYKKQTDREKQNAASTLLAQLLGGGQPVAAITAGGPRPDDKSSPSQNETPTQQPAAAPPSPAHQATAPDINQVPTSLGSPDQLTAPAPSSPPTVNDLGGDAEQHPFNEDQEATDRVLKAAWDMSEPESFQQPSSSAVKSYFPENNNNPENHHHNNLDTSNHNHAAHDFILNTINNDQTKLAPDVNNLYPDIAAPLSTPRTAKEALAQHNLMTAEYFSAGSANSGPAPRMVGYPELPSPSEAGPSRQDSDSAPSSEPRIQAYAKLEFDDGHFYVNTFSFILGRDVRAARAAFQREAQVKQEAKQAKAQGSSGGSVAATPNKSRQDGSGSGNGNGAGNGVVGSVVSDKGGIMGFDPDVPQHGPPQVSWKSSNNSSSADQKPGHPILHMSEQHQQPQTVPSSETVDKPKDYNALAMESLQRKNEPKRVDTLTLLPSAEACPTIPVHPPAPADGVVSSHRSISRKHVKIAYNFSRSLFEMEVMGRNGAFKGADWLAPGQVRPLHSGDYIQIGGVRVRFLLPDVPIGDTGAEEADSPAPEDEEVAAANAADEEDAMEIDSAAEAAAEKAEAASPELETEGKSEAPKAKVKASAAATGSSARASADANSTTQPPVKRRGPGRPPKDGIMSKRERAEIAREQKLAAKREANGGVTPPPPPSRPKTAKGGAKDGDAATEEPLKAEKRKYTKRKKPEAAGPGDVVLPSIEEKEGGSAEPTAGPDASPRVPTAKKRKPSRSPSPEYPPESFYTAKELAKPPYNYAVLIYDALSESPTPMTLKQIYRALKLKYPYFRFKCETEGWTSSVRHNLNGNSHLFMHAERDGKGWSWKIIPGASVDKEKKRRPSPSPLQDPGVYGQNQHYHHASATPQYPVPEGPVHPNSQQYPNQPPPHPHPHPHQPPPPQHPNAAGNSSFGMPPPPQPSSHQGTPYPPGPPPQAQFVLPVALRNTMPSAFAPPANPSYRSPYPASKPSRPPARGQHQQHRQHYQPPRQQQPNYHPRQPQQAHHPHPPPPQQARQPPLQQQPQSQPQQQHHPHSHSHPPPPPHPPAQPHSQPPSTFTFQARPQPVPTNPNPHPPQTSQANTAKPQTPNQGAPPHQQSQPYPSSSLAPENHQYNPSSAASSHQNAAPNAAAPAPPSQQQQQQAPTKPDSDAFTARANQAIDNFEAVLIEDYDDKEYIQQVLRSARNRVLNGAEKSSFPGGEPKDEVVIMDALRGIIGQLNNEEQ